MKTLVLFIAEIGVTIQGGIVDKAQHYFGLKNVDLDIDRDFPGCAYKGLLSEDEKKQAEDYILEGTNGIGIFFVEYEKDDSNDINCITLLRKEECKIVNNI